MGYRLPGFAISAASERTVLWIHVYIWQHIRAIVERAALEVKEHTWWAALKVKGANIHDISALSIDA